MCNRGWGEGAGVYMPLPLLPGVPCQRRRHEDDALLALPPGLPFQVCSGLEGLFRVLCCCSHHDTLQSIKAYMQE